MNASPDTASLSALSGWRVRELAALGATEMASGPNARPHSDPLSGLIP